MRLVPRGELGQLGVGLYPLAEAARLLRTPRRTLARWVEGYVQQLRDVERKYLPVIETGGASVLTFGELIELLYVRGFRDAGVPLETIRRAAAKYRRVWGTNYSLATKRFATDGRALLLHEGGIWQDALTGQQSAFLEELGSCLVHKGDFASEWRPLGKDRSVVLAPDRAFGTPIDDLSGTRTYVLSQAVAAGEAAQTVAWWYGTTSASVEDATVFERNLAARKPHGHVLL